MVQCYKRKGRLSFDSDISSPEGKKICESPRSDPNINTTSDEGEDDDQVLEALNMTERIASQLEMICQTLASVENRLQRLEGIQLFRERLSCKRGKAYAIMSKVIMGDGGFYGCLSKPQGVSAWWKETAQTRIRFFSSLPLNRLKPR